jgi:PAS domain S-box-containing protein
VLLIGDSDAEVNLLVRYLRHTGVQLTWERVEEATTLRRALDEKRWDLILCHATPKTLDAPTALRMAEETGAPFVVLSGGMGQRLATALWTLGVGRHTTEYRRAEEEQARRQEQTLALKEIVSATASTLDLHEVLDTSLRSVLALSGVDRAQIMLLDRETDTLQGVAARGPHGPLPTALRLTRGQGAAGRVLAEGKPIIIPDVRRDPLFVRTEENWRGRPGPAHGYVGLPLISRGHIIGILSLVTTGPRSYEPDEVTFLQAICGAAAVSIENAIIHQDIQRRAERLAGEIAVQKDYAENVVRSITDGVATVDARDRIVSWNNGARTITGFSAEQVVGKPCGELFREQSAQGEPLCGTAECPLKRVSAGQATSTQEVMGLHRDGHWFVASASAAPLFDDKGHFQGMVRIFRDISRERALLDGLQRAAQAKSAFLANMSHEIRTPLNAVLGFSQLLLRDPALAAAQRPYLESIARSGEHLLALMEDVLQMSKIEAGRVACNPVSFGLDKFVGDLASMFRLRVQEKGLDFFVECSDGPRVLEADEQKLRQILVNLLGNAVKFTAAGSVRLSVRLHHTEAGLTLSALVEDTGPGIPEADADRVFQAFEQTEVGIRAGGTGLGLAISRQFARMMGGELTLHRHAGPGAHLQVVVPVKEIVSEEAGKEAVVREPLLINQVALDMALDEPTGPVVMQATSAARLRAAAASADYEGILETLDNLQGVATEDVARLRRLAERFDYPGLLARIQVDS